MDVMDCCTEKSWGTLGKIVMTITSLLTPLTVLYHNPRYLVSMTGFADGGDMYSHFAEAVHVKEQMEKGVFSFWFDQVSLGYPMFTAYQPLPCFLIASLMTIFQRLMTPQLVFRLIFVIVLTLIPASVYQSSKILGLRPLHGVSLCLLTFAIQSWRKFGLEISAFIEYGLLTQAFGMLLLFPVVSVLYRWIIIEDCQKETSTLPVILLAVTFLSNFFFGIYACILSAAMLLVKIANRNCTSICCLISKVQSFACMHVHSIFLISWWIIACLWSYDYVGGLPWRGESEDGYPLTTVLERFTEGEVFDSNRFFPWLTILVILGITLHAFNLPPKELGLGSCSEEDRTYSSWLMLSSLLSLILFLGRTTFSVFYNLIPLHSELETIKYLNALHFCGLLHASYAITALFRLVADTLVAKFPFPMTPDDCTAKRCKQCCCLIDSVKTHAKSIREKVIAITALIREYKTTLINSVLLLSLAAVLWFNQYVTIATHVTMAEVDNRFISRLKELRNGTVPGRIFGHRALGWLFGILSNLYLHDYLPGTASTFDLAFIPMYTGKPGLLTYSRGYHDSLSVFYMESLQFNPDRTDIFVNTLRLYNVHYVVTSSTKLDAAFTNACKMKEIAKIDDLVFYEVLHEDPDYGYFEFIRIPGRIRGELKLIRQAVLKLIELFNVNSLLIVNPHESLDVTDDVIVDVRRFGFWEGWGNFTQQKVHVTWTLKGREIDSELLLDEILKGNSWKWIYSQVMEERINGVEYQAVVHVSDHGKQTSDREHLLLKVTYHPFWKCYYYTVSDHFLLDRFDHARLLDGKVYTQINHVTPNLMSVTLPPGRHLVVFTYRFPGILKLLALACGIFFVKMLAKYLFYCENETSDHQDETEPKEKEKEVFIDMHSRNRQHPTWPYGSTNSVARSFEETSHKHLDASRIPEEDENDNEKVKTWKVGGRLRSLSIAAKQLFKNATNFTPSVQIPKINITRSVMEESGEWIDTSGRDIDPANIRSTTSFDEIASEASREKVCSHIRRSLSDSELGQYSHESISRKSNLSAREMHSKTSVQFLDNYKAEGDNINGRRSQTKIQSILSRKKSDEEDSVMNLRDRLRRLCTNSPPDKSTSEGRSRSHHLAGIVQQLRQNYLKERRTTLANVPNLRKR